MTGVRKAFSTLTLSNLHVKYNYNGTLTGQFIQKSAYKTIQKKTFLSLLKNVCCVNSNESQIILLVCVCAR